MTTTPAPRPFAVVTGASSGIGLELAKQFAANGFDLLVAAEDPGIADTAAELRGYGAMAEGLQVRYEDRGMLLVPRAARRGGAPVALR